MAIARSPATVGILIFIMKRIVPPVELNDCIKFAPTRSLAAKVIGIMRCRRDPGLGIGVAIQHPSPAANDQSKKSAMPSTTVLGPE